MQVMIVDMLEGFTRVGPLASPRVDALVPLQADFLRRLPPGGTVVFLADEHTPEDFELKRFPPHCMSGTIEADIRRELLDAARATDAEIHTIRKRGFSGFTCGTDGDLDRLVTAAPSTDWIIIGCVTDCCIETNVADLVLRDRHVTVIRDLIDTWNLTPEQARIAGLPESHVHDADRINEEWFTHRFPAIWGARMVDHWQELF